MIQSPLDVYETFRDSHPDYKDAIKLDFLPYEKHRVDEVWKPKSVNVLFLGESPSWHSSGPYFYDPELDFRTNQVFIRLFFYNNKHAMSILLFL